MGSFSWDWGNDAAHPTAYTPNGAGAVVLNGAGAWEHKARWYRPGDWQFDDMWAVRSYTGDMPSTMSVSGVTATDGQRLDLNFELFSTIAPAVVPPTVVDNADSGYAETGGNWLGYSETGAYETGFRYHAAGTGENTANWTFTGLDANKQYQVYVTWSAASNRASNAPFTVSDGTTALATVRLNQQFAAGDATIDDRGWESVGVYTTSSGSLRISLSDDANGYVIADAVRIVEVPAATTAQTVVDEGGAAYAETGSNWLGYSESGSFNGDFRYHAAGTGQNTANWTLAGLDSTKQYQVYVTWTAASNRASNSPFTVSDGTTALGTVRLNQQFAPGDATIDDQGWESIGVYTTSSGTLQISLSDDANGYVIADAVRIVEVPMVANASTVVDEGDSSYAEAGSNWLGYDESGSLNGDFRYHAAGTGSNTATWTIAALPGGAYQVYTRWAPGSNRATNAPYTIYDGSSSLGTVRLDQQSTPNDLVGSTQGPELPWASLGVFTIDSGTLRVVLSDDANGIVIADAIRIIPVVVNQAPSLQIGSSQTVVQGAGQQTVSGFITNVSPGPASEASQTVAIQVSVDHPELFLQQPTIDAQGTLTYTPVFNATGTATITVVAVDNGGTLGGGQDTSAPQTFTISVVGTQIVGTTTSVYDLNANGDWTAHAKDSYLQRDDATVNKVVADDFVLSQTSDIQKLTVRGSLNIGYNGMAPENVVVSFMADNGETDVDSQAPSTTLKTITVPWTDCSYVDGVLTVDFSADAADWFHAEAGTRYWFSVQPTVYDGAGSFRIYWNNDLSHPSSYTAQGSGAVVLDSSGNWQHEGRWWSPGDIMNDPTWVVQGYAGSLPTSVQSSYGATCGDAQRLDMSFELFGLAAQATVAMSGEAIAFVYTPYTLTLGQLSGPMASSVASYSIDWGDQTVSTQIAANELPADGQVVHVYTIDETWSTIVVTLRNADNQILGQQRMEIFVDPPTGWQYVQDANQWDLQTALGPYLSRETSDANRAGELNRQFADDFVLTSTTDVEQVAVKGNLVTNGHNPYNVVVSFMADSDDGSANLDAHTPSVTLKSIVVPWGSCSYSGGVLNVNFSTDAFHAVAGVRYWLSVKPTVYNTATDYFAWDCNNDNGVADMGGSNYTPNGAAAVAYYASLGEWVHQARWGNISSAQWNVQGYTGDLLSTVQYPFSKIDCVHGQRLDLSFRIWGTISEAPHNEVVLRWSPQNGDNDWEDANWVKPNGDRTAWIADAIAVFDGQGTGTIDVSSAISVSGIKYYTDGYTIAGSGSIALPAGTGVIEVGQDATAEIDCAIQGGKLIKTGPGRLVLDPTVNNTYSGGTVLGGGELSIDHDALGTATSTITFSGGTLRVTGTTLQTLDGTGRHTIAAGFDGGFNIANVYNTFTVHQALSGSGLEKTGKGMLELMGTVNFTGWTVVSAGTLYINQTSAIGGEVAAPGGVIVGPGAPKFWTITLGDMQHVAGSVTFDESLSASPVPMQASDQKIAALYALAGKLSLEEFPNETWTYSPSPAMLDTYTDMPLAKVNGLGVWLAGGGSTAQSNSMSLMAEGLGDSSGSGSNSGIVINVNDGQYDSTTGQVDAVVTLGGGSGSASASSTGSGSASGSSGKSGPGDSSGSGSGSSSCSCPSATGTGVVVGGTGQNGMDPYASLFSPDGNGQHYTIAQLGWLRVFGHDSDLIVEVGSESGRVQQWLGSSLAATNPGQQGTLSWNSTEKTYTETDRDGTQFVFAWGAAGYQRGQLIKKIPASGQGSLTYTYSLNDSEWATYRQIDDQWTERATFTFDAESGRVTQQTLDVVKNLVLGASPSLDTYSEITHVGKIDYVYYGTGSQNGNVGDLQLIRSYKYNSNSASYALTDTTYYRWYVGTYDATTNPGLNDYLKCILTGAPTERLLAANGWAATDFNLLSNLETLSDDSLALYADQFFKYTPTGVVSEMDTGASGCSCAGGLAQTYYSYVFSDLPSEPNNWHSERVERIGNTTTTAAAKTIATLYNSSGQTILQDVTDGSNVHWVTYTTYDAYGHATTVYQPSAIASWSIDTTTKELQVTFANTGLANVSEYYTNSDDLTTGPSDPGGVVGYLKRSGVKNLATDTTVWESSVDYIAVTVNDVTAYYTHSSTQYRGTNLDDPLTTTYAYTFYTTEDGVSGPTIHTKTTILPIVTDGTGGTENQHGSGAANSTIATYDVYGRLTSTEDAAGVVSSIEYDPVTGAAVERVQDVGGQDLVTTYKVDAQGRTIATIDAGGNVTWTVYNDAQHEVRVYPGWHFDSVTSSWQTTGPIQVTRSRLAAPYSAADSTVTFYNESLTYSWTGSFNTVTIDGLTAPQGDEAYSSGVIQSLSRSILNSSGQKISMLQYTSVDGAAYTDDYAAFGVQGQNYLRADYYYDRLGRLYSTHNSNGTVVDTFYDAMNHVTAVWQGTDDIPTVDYNGDGILDPRDYRTWVKTNGTAVEKTDAGVNMYLVSTSTYNKDGQVLESNTYYDATSQTAGLSYTTEYAYDWRNRLTYSLSTSDFLTQYVYDNLGRVTATYGYANASIIYVTIDGNLYGVSVSYASGSLRSRSETLYDALGRTYESRVYEVDPTTGVAGDYLATDYWYDARGYLVKSRTGSGGAFQKSSYDSVGNLTYSYTSLDADELDTNTSGYNAYQAALSVDGDTVIEQTQNWYDADRRTVASANYKRLPSDTSTGVLTATNAYVTAMVTCYDAIGRTVKTVNYGREDVNSGLTHYIFHATSGSDAGGSYSAGDLIDIDRDNIPDEAESNSRLPYSSNTTDSSNDGFIVAESVYRNTSVYGQIVDQIDNLGRINRTEYDLAGRVIRSVQNYKDGNPATIASDSSTFGTDQDATVSYEYDSQGRLTSQTAVNVTGYNVTAENVMTSTPVDGSYIMYSAAGVSGHHFLVVHYNGSAWQYDNGTGFTDFPSGSRSGSDVLVASISVSGSVTIGNLATNGTVEGISRGYDAGSIGFTYSAGQFHVTSSGSAYFSRITNQVTRYLYASPFNPTLQTAVVYPDVVASNAQGIQSLTQSSGVATAFIASNHGYNIGDWVCISGATEDGYDGWVQIVSVPTGTSFTFAVDGSLPATAIGNLTVRALGQDITTTDYDRLGRKVVSTDQRGVTHRYSFDTAGRLSADSVTSLGAASENVDNSVLAVVTTYDDMGRTQTITNYDSATARETTNVVNQVQYSYDSWGNVRQSWQAHSGAVDPIGTASVQYQYSDGLGAGSGRAVKYVRLTDMIDPAFRYTSYCYDLTAIDDVLSRVGAIIDFNSDEIDYTYLGKGTIVEELNSGYAKLSYLDGTTGNVTGLDRFGRIVDQIWTDFGSNEIDRYTYTYDRAGNRTSKVNAEKPAVNESYTYDDLNRLTSSNRADNYDQSWTLDGLGNFAAYDNDGDVQTRAANEVNEIASTSGIATPTYDAAGNMTSNGTLTYKYDAWNRLVEVRQVSDSSLVATYSYDGQNQRVMKTLADGTTTDFYYNQRWQMVQANTQSGSTKFIDEYVWSISYVNAPLVRQHSVAGTSGVANARYYTWDANHNVTTMITATGGNATTNHVVYNAYGTATVYDDSWNVVGAPSEDGPLYCGYFFDAETGLYQVRNRYYDASLAVWISRDPIGYKGGNNLYEYIRDNPLLWTDPTGLYVMCDCKTNLYKGGGYGVVAPDASGCTSACSDQGASWTGNIYGPSGPYDPKTNPLTPPGETLPPGCVVRDGAVCKGISGQAASQPDSIIPWDEKNVVIGLALCPKCNSGSPSGAAAGKMGCQICCGTLVDQVFGPPAERCSDPQKSVEANAALQGCLLGCR